VVKDSHHFNEEQDPDPHKSEKLDPEPEPHLSVKSWIRIHIKVMRIRNPAFTCIAIICVQRLQ
jgi:hypothetical protein